MDSNSVKVNIFGHTYNINGDAPEEYILSLAEYVHSKMEEVSGATSNSNPTQVAILVALNIADEYFQLKKMKQNVDGVLEDKARELISMLDEGLIGDIFSRVQSISDS